MQQLKDKFEKDKYDLQKQPHFCMHQANMWLYGQTPASLRNSESWRLAEEEGAEGLSRR